MNTQITTSCDAFLACVDQTPVGFFAVRHFPHPSTKKFKAGHRLVILPDWQGLGIGHLFSTEIAKHYKQKGNRFIITSSTLSLYKQRAASPEWIVTRKGRTNGISYSSTLELRASSSSHKITFSYEYVGNANG